MSTLRNYVAALRRNFGLYTIAFVLFSIFMGLMEAMGVFRELIGYLFLGGSLLSYAAIAWYCRTNDPDEFYVSGRRIPGFFNGMATAADWMSAATFIGLAGTLYVQGFDGLAYVMGWTGGYVLVGLLIAPYLRQFGGYTIPEFLGTRYGGHSTRMIAIAATLLCSFVYMIAQIYGVGLIVSRFTGTDFGIGVFLGLAGILVCSFFGGMKAVTWTQVAQLIVRLCAYLIPAFMMAYQQTSIPIPQISYGSVLEKVTQQEIKLTSDPGEVSARKAMTDLSARAQVKLADIAKNPDSLTGYFEADKQKAKEDVAIATALEDAEVMESSSLKLKTFPATAEGYKKALEKEALVGERAVPPKPHAAPYQGKDDAEKFTAKINFLALVFCLMVGTASLPHILVRFLTTPTVREARQSVFWSLFFILIIYTTAPALALFIKYDIYTNLVGMKFSEMPFWVAAWSNVDANLLSVIDFNLDGVIQLAEITIGSDLIMLAAPEIAGLPFVISGLVAVGGFASALSVANGLLMSMSGSVAQDVYYTLLKPRASAETRAKVAKFALLFFALLAAGATLTRPGSILFMVAAAFSIAGASLFPALVLGIFWRGANKEGAVAGMLAGMGVTVYYMLRTYSFFTDLGVPAMDLWFEIAPVASGVFGIAAGFAVMLVVSILTKRPKQKELLAFENLHYPHSKDLSAEIEE